MMNKSSKQYTTVFNLLLLALLGLPTTAWAMNSNAHLNLNLGLTEGAPLSPLYSDSDDESLDMDLFLPDITPATPCPSAEPQSPQPAGSFSPVCLEEHEVAASCGDDENEEDSIFEDAEPADNPESHALAVASKHSVATQPRPNKRRRFDDDTSKKFVCNQPGCKYATNQNSHLRRHQRTHTSAKPFKCEECSTAFNRQDNLKTHMRKHTGERPFKCDKCEKAFALKGNLKTHQRAHTGVKPFKCDTCDAAFTLKGNLDKHMRTHTGEKPFQCQECGNAFTRKDHLSTHMHTRHHQLTPAKPDHAVEEDSLDTHEEHDDE